MRFVASLITEKQSWLDSKRYILSIGIEADSKYEAEGMARKYMEKYYPKDRIEHLILINADSSTKFLKKEDL